MVVLVLRLLILILPCPAPPHLLFYFPGQPHVIDRSTDPIGSPYSHTSPRVVHDVQATGYDDWEVSHLWVFPNQGVFQVLW